MIGKVATLSAPVSGAVYMCGRISRRIVGSFGFCVEPARKRSPNDA